MTALVPRPGSIERTILVVELDPHQRISLAAALGREGWIVQLAALGSRGLAIAAWFEPMVVVVDVGITDIAPIDVVRLLHGSGRAPRALVIGTLPADGRPGLYAEFDAVLVKPVSAAQLLSTIEQLAIRAADPGIG